MVNKSFGVVNRSSATNEEELYAEELSLAGYTVIENVLTGTELQTFREKLDSVYSLQVGEFSEKQLELLQESFMARLPLAYDDYFIELIRKEKIISILQQVLGNYFVLNLQNGIINMPNQPHHQNAWHRDLPYQDFTISKPLAVSVLYCIDDFSEQTGGTVVVPFSHKTDRMPSERYLRKHARQITAESGSVILFDSMIFHKAGYNSSVQVRRGVNHMFTAPILKQQINIPESLQGKFKEDPFLRMLLGYETTTPKNVYDWRNERLKKK